MSTVLTSIEDKIAILTINKESSLNALSEAVLDDLHIAFANLENDNNIHIIILTGAGEKAFIAGADIKEMSNLKPNEAFEYARKGQLLTEYIENFPKPVIGAINGFALGGGCEFAMACHIRYASENAMFGQPEVGLGLIAGFGGTQRLPRLVGKGNALELLLSGKMINASVAKEIGLINKILPQNELLPECIKLAKKIAKNAPIALTNTIKAVNQGIDIELSDALNIEAEQFKEIFETSDKTEGLSAFVEKRKPNFIGK
jgi:enoyl-CoA hydratase